MLDPFTRWETARRGPATRAHHHPPVVVTGNRTLKEGRVAIAGAVGAAVLQGPRGRCLDLGTDCRSARGARTSLFLGARCNLRLPDDFQIGSGRHFFARCVPHLPPHPGHEKRNRRKPGGEERGERVIAVPRHIVCIIPDVHPAVFSR